MQNKHTIFKNSENKKWALENIFKNHRWNQKTEALKDNVEETFQEVEWKGKRVRDCPGGPVVKTPSFPTGNVGSIPGQGPKIPSAMWCSQKKKQRCRKGNIFF